LIPSRIAAAVQLGPEGRIRILFLPADVRIIFPAFSSHVARELRKRKPGSGSMILKRLRHPRSRVSVALGSSSQSSPKWLLRLGRSHLTRRRDHTAHWTTSFHRRLNAPGRIQVRPPRRTDRRCRTGEPPLVNRETRGGVTPLEFRMETFGINSISSWGLLQYAPTKFLYRPSSRERITSVDRGLFNV